jgi:hypothetical protein
MVGLVLETCFCGWFLRHFQVWASTIGAYNAAAKALGQVEEKEWCE